MAVTKKKLFSLECEGPCKQSMMTESPGLPRDWTRLKIEPVFKLHGQKQTYRVATLCGKCTELVMTIIQDVGVELAPVNMEAETKLL